MCGLKIEEKLRRGNCPVHRMTSSLIVAVIVWSSSSMLDAQLANSPWPMFHKNSQHTGLSPYAGPSIAPRLRNNLFQRAEITTFTMPGRQNNVIMALFCFPIQREKAIFGTVSNHSTFHIPNYFIINRLRNRDSRQYWHANCAIFSGADSAKKPGCTQPGQRKAKQTATV